MKQLSAGSLSSDRTITPRLGPKRRPASKNGWDWLTAADIARIADQIKQALNS
jgi:hypothetical protein